MDKGITYDQNGETWKDNDCVREVSAAYQLNGEKRQGEYTLEDYYAIPDEYRVELIDGVIYDMAAPTIIHQLIGPEIWTTLKDFIKKKKGKCIAMLAPVDVQLDRNDKTMVQPDVLVVCDRDKLRRRYLYGEPDFVVEILSPSTAKKDRILKMNKYRNAGVKEYWLVDPEEKRIIVHEFEKQIGPRVYGFDARVPVGIFEGKCKVDFAEIYKEIEFLLV